MSAPEPEGEPTKRQWLGYWSMIVQQTQNAFNDKAAQFILIPLGGAVAFEFYFGEISGKAISLSVESAAGLMIALPFVLFAPVAGWMSDRFSKRNVIVGAAIAQVCILSLICTAVFLHNMPLALVGFFLLAVQSAFFSPAKIGINKELVGSKHLGFAAGVQQMMAMLAILAGQIVAGWWYDKRYVSLGSVSEKAWDAAFFPLILLACFSVPAVAMAISIPKVPAHGRENISGKLLFSHFKDLGELWRDRGLRRASFGVAYFWGFAAFINLWSVKVAKSLTAGGEGFGTMSSVFMAAASLGMAVGFGFASWLLRKRIELGWVPLSGIAMTVCALVVAFLTPGGWPFLIWLGLLAFSAAMFLSPLNAWMQDRYPADKRGELQSAVNLQDCFAGILAVAAIEGMYLLAKLIGMSELAGFRMQMVVIGLSCGLMTWFILRILPADFIRLVCLSATKALYRIRFSGTYRIPKTGGVLLLPNHVTFADAFFISAACDRPVRFVMDETFMANRLIRFSVRLFDAVTIRRDQPLEAIRKTIEALESGHVVALFPEGQITRTGALCGLERGFELIARKARSPIFPMWVDGSWGSVFSFERGRFFRKLPHRVPYGLSIAVGEEITGKPDLELVRTAIMRTSTEAVGGRFPENTARSRINAHQLTQLDALPRGGTIHLLAGDDMHGIVDSLEEFAKQTRTRIVTEKAFEPSSGTIWIGGETLRKCIAAPEAPQEPIRFFDFSNDALTPLEKGGVTHLPCLAVDGMVIAMSLPHPPLPKNTSEFQAGHKPDSWGKLLPGWHIEGGQVFPGGLALPEGATLDRECFLMRGE
jgi:acyl-[acyl-carrier-protein]-phospholipid O-acyltransferase/long-chain-fatty-acid--[acyl-carrier-protein] ligase